MSDKESSGTASEVEEEVPLSTIISQAQEFKKEMGPLCETLISRTSPEALASLNRIFLYELNASMALCQEGTARRPTAPQSETAFSLASIPTLQDVINRCYNHSYPLDAAFALDLLLACTNNATTTTTTTTTTTQNDTTTTAGATTAAATTTNPSTTTATIGATTTTGKQVSGWLRFAIWKHVRSDTSEAVHHVTQAIKEQAQQQGVSTESEWFGEEGVRRIWGLGKDQVVSLGRHRSCRIAAAPSRLAQAAQGRLSRQNQNILGPLTPKPIKQIHKANPRSGFTSSPQAKAFFAAGVQVERLLCWRKVLDKVEWKVRFVGRSAEGYIDEEALGDVTQYKDYETAKEKFNIRGRPGRARLEAKRRAGFPP